MAAALGYLFLDRHGTPLDPLPCNFASVERIRPPETLPRIEVIGLTDVRNGLLGPQGATFVYGPQKGASPSDVEKLEAGLARIADIAARDLGSPDPATPGAGAAGGLGFGVMAFLRGSLRPGFETVAKLIGLAEAVAAADLVITGEGRIDGQTCEGKAPDGVARLARAAGKPVIALAGSIPLTKEDVAGFDVLVPITDEPMSLEHAMRNAGPLLERAAARTAMLIKLGHLL
jgi:glycerate 2-kinase